MIMHAIFGPFLTASVARLELRLSSVNLLQAYSGFTGFDFRSLSVLVSQLHLWCQAR